MQSKGEEGKVTIVRRYSRIIVIAVAWVGILARPAAAASPALPGTGLGDTVLYIVGGVLIVVAAGVAWAARSR